MKYMKSQTALFSCRIFLTKSFPPKVYIRLIFVCDIGYDNAMADTKQDDDSMYISIALAQLCLSAVLIMKMQKQSI